MQREKLSNARPEGRKKVLIVVHQLNFGGAQKALLSALDAIDYHKNDVTLYVRKARLDLLPEVNPGVSRIIINEDHTHYYRRPYAVLLQLLDRLSSLGGKKPSPYEARLRDYVVRQGMQYEKTHYFSDGTVYDLAISYLQGWHALFVADYVDAKRKVMFYHGSTDELHELHETVMEAFSTICCVSNPAQDEIRRCYPAYAEKIHCIENVVDAERIRAKSREFKVPAPKERIVLCTCGRFAPVKGFDLAVEAAERLRDTGLPFYWYFVGDGPERAALERQIEEKGLRDCIEITGMQKNPYPYIKACDIYVQPSREEAHPLAIIEAQVLCKPVVSTKTAGGRALVEDGATGALTEIDAQALADGIMKLAGDAGLCEDMSRKLAQIDYDEKAQRFRRQWSALLEGEAIEI